MVFQRTYFLAERCLLLQALRRHKAGHRRARSSVRRRRAAVPAGGVATHRDAHGAFVARGAVMSCRSNAVLLLSAHWQCNLAQQAKISTQYRCRGCFGCRWQAHL